MPFDLTIVTPEGQAFRGNVDSVVLPGSEGDFGVLPGHEAFLSGLRIGVAEIEQEGKKLIAALSGGFAEVHGQGVSVMVSTCEFASEIDVQRAALAEDRARRMLEEMRTTEEGEGAYQGYMDAYSRAVTRLDVSKRFQA